MPELVEWLLERIAEDEATARAAIGRSGIDAWEAVGGGTVVGPAYDRLKHIMLPSSEDATAQHIARHDPARVLAECEAKRRIVQLAVTPDPHAAGEGCPECEVLYLLAFPYADRPGYRDEWRP